MRKTWTDSRIASELATVIAGSGVMPTAQHLNALGRSDLANQISRHGGFLSWAKRLGANRTHSDSDTGWSGEIALAEKLSKEGFSVTRLMEVKAPYDLRVNEILRIDVKSSNFASYGTNDRVKGWFYRIGKEAQADVLALYQLDTGVCYFIPWNLCPTTNITIARDGGKYQPFKDRYDIVRELVSYRERERGAIRKALSKTI